MEFSFSVFIVVASDFYLFFSFPFLFVVVFSGENGNWELSWMDPDSRNICSIQRQVIRCGRMHRSDIPPHQRAPRVTPLRHDIHNHISFKSSKVKIELCMY